VKVQRSQSALQIQLEGAIGETTPMFALPMAGLTEISLDLSGVKSINSIGIKQWILWTLKVPQSCSVKMIKVPFLLATQASMVVGFAPSNFAVESMSLPFVCESCGHEFSVLIERGTHYQYAVGTQPRQLSLPDGAPCPKCKSTEIDSDYIVEKTFKFLDVPLK
jgi:hypothetical protein